ncbi:MAG TPA: aldo/keto reductase [Rectinemataceae bacterium]
MESVQLPGTDIRTSRLIAGCMGLGGGWDRSRELDSSLLSQARDFLSAALDLDIRFFDHADVYAYGRAEEVFGRALAERPGSRPDIIIQTKCGIRWAGEPPGSPHRYDFSKEHILRSVEGSLGRLKCDYVDILLLHRPDPLWEGEEIAEAFSALRTQGKVRYFGVSNQNRAQMEYLQSFLPFPLVANQLQMSLLHSDFVEAGISFNQDSPSYPDGWEGVLEYCRLKGVSLQAWSPLDRGALFGQSASEGSKSKAAILLHAMAEARGEPPEAIALAWLLRHPSGIMPVLGTSKPSRLADCARATAISLSREEWYSLFAASRGREMP